jgi:hypothetical protein
MNGYYFFDMLLNFFLKNHVGGFHLCCSNMEEIMNMKRFLLAILGIQAIMFAYLEMCRIPKVIVIQAHLQHVQFFMQTP